MSPPAAPRPGSVFYLIWSGDPNWNNDAPCTKEACACVTAETQLPWKKGRAGGAGSVRTRSNRPHQNTPQQKRVKAAPKRGAEPRNSRQRCPQSHARPKVETSGLTTGPSRNRTFTKNKMRIIAASRAAPRSHNLHACLSPLVCAQLR